MSFFDSVTTEFLKLPNHPSIQPTLTDLLIATSKCIDYLEGRPVRHGVKIAAIAGALAEVFRLGPREKTSVLYAALLHDVGLARIAANLSGRLPDTMTEKDIFYGHAMLNAGVMAMPLDKKLYKDVEAILHTHPQAAGTMVEAFYLSDDVKELIAAHHENYDGSGYPLQLRGDAIPLGARILAFADVIESLLEEATGLNGRQSALESFFSSLPVKKFDPEVVSAFRSLTSGVEGENFIRQVFSNESERLARSHIDDRRHALASSPLLSMIETMAKISDNLTPQYTGNHSTNVARIAANMAKLVGANPYQCGELILAGLLHDIGMVSVPIPILLKPEPLSPEELEIVHQHPRCTGDILKGISGFDNICHWASQHQERMNGSGYHCGSRGLDIATAARMLAIADVYDALVSPRPFRPHTYEPLDALSVIGQGRFRYFDNKLVNILRTVVMETEIKVGC